MGHGLCVMSYGSRVMGLRLWAMEPWDISYG